MTRVRSETGFTLIEVLVSMAIAVTVFGATLSVLDVFQRDNRLDNLRNESQDEARTAIDALSRELRNGAAPSSTTPGALEKAGRYSIVFQTIEPTTHPITSKNKTNAVRVRYCLQTKEAELLGKKFKAEPNNEVLWKQTFKWTLTELAPPLPTASECPDPNTADYETATQVAHHLVNRNGFEKHYLFTYIPASPPASVAEITAVEPDIYLDVSPGQVRPGEKAGGTQLTSSIDLRNENRPPLASFTVKEIGNRRFELNASQSTDPDGLALTYKWWVDSEQLSSTSPETTTKELPLGNHTFKLVVTTPSELASTDEIKLNVTS